VACFCDILFLVGKERKSSGTKLRGWQDLLERIEARAFDTVDGWTALFLDPSVINLSMMSEGLFVAPSGDQSPNSATSFEETTAGTTTSPEAKAK
jgi:hypothetical protein